MVRRAAKAVSQAHWTVRWGGFLLVAVTILSSTIAAGSNWLQWRGAVDADRSQFRAQLQQVGQDHDTILRIDQHVCDLKDEIETLHADLRHRSSTP
jgi:hypothetical protein